MKTKTQITAILITSITLLGSSVTALAHGADSSGGGDNKPSDYESAWFLGARSIRTCYQRDPSFAINSDEIESTIQKSFGVWQKYLVDKKVNRGRSDASEQLVLNYSLASKCDGTEDLTFYFGTKNAEINQAKSQFSNPSAFAQRRSYDPKAKWGNGFIWVAQEGDVDVGTPNWKVPYSLQGMLLHELGHVLGNGHVDGTIMDQDIAMMVGANRYYNPDTAEEELQREQILSSVDGKKELDYCDECTNLFLGSMRDSSTALAADTFEKFVGRKPRGSIFMTANMLPTSPSQPGGVELSIKDNSETHVLRLDSTNTTPVDGEYFDVWEPVFKIAFADPAIPGNVDNLGRHEEAYVVSMIYKASDSESYVITIHRDMDGGLGNPEQGPLNITYASTDGKWKGELFSSFRSGLSSYQINPTF